jgi:hypothetical protein
MVLIEIGSGTLRIAGLDVIDTFGQRRTAQAAGEGEPGRRSRLFRLSTPGSDATADALLVPPIVGASLESAPVEQVRFARDENANLVWAIERTVESAAGRPLDLRRDQPVPPTPTGADSTDVSYRMMSRLPRHWLPLVPPDAAAPPPLALTCLVVSTASSRRHNICRSSDEPIALGGKILPTVSTLPVSMQMMTAGSVWAARRRPASARRRRALFGYGRAREVRVPCSRHRRLI